MVAVSFCDFRLSLAPKHVSLAERLNFGQGEGEPLVSAKDREGALIGQATLFD